MTGEALYAHALFCDDIRHEMSGKVTYVGTYGPDMLVARFPVLLPKLCAAVFVVMPEETKARSLSVRVLRDQDPLAQLDADIQETLPSEQVVPDVGPPEEKRLIAAVTLTMRSLEIEKPARLRVQASVDDTMLPAGALTIFEAPHPPPPDESAAT